MMIKLNSATAALAAILVVSSAEARKTTRGYELEYIGTSGTTTGPWIDTGIKPKPSIRTVIDMACLSTVKNAGLFGIVNQTVSYTMYRNTGTPAGWGMAHQNGNGDWQYSGHLADTARHVFDFNHYIASSNAYFLIYDGMTPYTKLTGSLTQTGSQAIGLGIRRSSATGGDLSLHRIWSCQIYDGETLVRDFVPWVTYAGKTGLWDRKESVFHGSASVTSDYIGTAPVTNRVYFFSEWEDKCSSSPAFGLGGHVYAHGATVTATFGPAPDVNGCFSDGVDDFHFRGWRLWRNGEVVATGQETTMSFTHDASSIEEVEWLIDPDFHFSFTSEGPGTIVTNGVSEDWTITMTAVPAEGKAFFRWKGDMDFGDDQVANPLTVDADRSRSIVAEFYDPATEPRVYFEAIEATAATGAQWIDTGYCPKSTTRTRIDFEPLETTVQQRVFGARGDYSFYAMYRNGSSKWAYAYITAYDGNWVNTGYAANNTTRRVFDFNYWDDGTKKRTGAIYSTAGTKLWSGALSGTITRDVPNSLAFGCDHTGKKVFAENARKHRFYSAILSESTSSGETVVRDFTPAAMRGVTGLWDRVEGRFYPSASFQGSYAGVNPLTNHLEVVSAEDWVDVTPAFGTHVCRNGDTISYHAPAVVTNGANAAICAGWKRFVNEVLVEEGSGNSFTRVKEWGKERVEWLFESAYQVVAEAGEGGSVETSGCEEWYAGGTTNAVTATAVPDEGYAFLCWLGDVPECVDAHGATISFEATGAGTLTAIFVRLDGENEVTLFEYVQTTDDRQFINTGYFTTPTTWAVLDAQYLMNEGQACILGNRGPLHYSIYQRGTADPGGNGALGYWFNSGDTGYADVGKNSDLDRHVFRCNYKVDNATRGFRMYNVDGTTFSPQKTYALQTQTATTPLCIGTWEPAYSRPARHRFYGLTIYEDGSDQPVRDFVPAAMGGATGVYDRVERKFYPSGGGGNYTTDSSPVAGRLYVDSAWRGFAAASPAFGVTNGIAAGATLSCTASSVVTNGDTAISCAGYVLCRDGLTVATGAVNTVTFQHAGGFENLTWLYDASYRMMFSAAAGGSVSPTNGWFAEGATVTATATPASGYMFYRWTGDLPEGADPTSATLVFAADAPRVFTATFSEATASGTKLYTGADYGSWDTAANWTPEGIPTATDAVYIPENKGVRIPLTADVFSLSISNGALVTVNGPTSKPSAISGMTAGNTATTAPVGLAVRGNLLLLGSGKLGIGGKNQHSYPYLAVGGDFTLSGTSSFAIHPGPFDVASGHDYPDGGATVSVGGTTTVGSGCGIYPWSHLTTYNKADQELTTGLGTVLNLHALVIEEGGLVSGYGKGYTRYSKCPSATDPGGSARGGSHAGRGGTVSASTSRLAAFDRPYAPVMPGGGGGNGSATGYVGGGAFRISATTVRLDGTIMSDGNYSAANVGGAAGGSVFLLCDDLEIGPAAMLSASGRYAGQNNAPAGGGGGGRIAIALGLTQAQSAALVADGNLPSGVGAREAVPLVPDGRLVVRGGIGNQWDSRWDDGESGTAYYLVNGALSTLAVAMVPASRVGVAPSAGLHAYAPGTTISATAPAYAPTTLDPTEALAPTDVSSPAAPADCASRRICTGWTLTDAGGAVVASGDTTNATFTVGSGAYTLTWNYGGFENRLDASAKDGGTVSYAQAWVAADASFPSLSAIPDDADHVFAYWMGDIDATNRFDNPVVLPANHARAVIAVFSSATPKTYTWNKFGNNTVYNWHDPASWTPNGIPGPNDKAIISRASGSQANAQIDQYACVSNLVVRGASAYLRIGSVTTSFGNQNQGYHTPLATFTSPIGLDVLGDLSVTNAGFVIAGGELLRQPAYVNVGGDVIVGGGAAQSRLCLYGAHTNSVADARFGGTSRLTVAGTTTVQNLGQIFASEHYTTDGYAAFSFNDLVVEEGGAVCAYNMGAKNYIRTGREINYPWPTHQQNSDGVAFGGSHAGRGGANAKGSGGAMQYVGEVFGYTNTPVHSGMQGGNYGGRPGGVLRIDAHSVVLAGSLLASGENGGNSGGAGGSVWVACDEFSATASAVINVNGGKPTKDATGGGGGRASICVGLTDEQLLALRDSDEVDGVLRTPLADVVPGFTAAGGDCASWTGSSGEDGTGVYIVHIGEGVTLTTSGEPAAAGVVSPAYGVTGQPSGEAFAIEAPATAEVPGTDGRSRYICGGYLVTNAAGTVLASGTGRTATLTLDEDAFLTWYWTNAEHSVSLSVAGGGTIRTNSVWDASSEWQREGAVFSVTAVPDEGQAFIGWLGEAQGLDRTSATLEFRPDQARALTARFATAEAGVKTWIGGTGDWMNDAGWRPSGIPGPATETRVPSGTVTLDCNFPVPVGSLYVYGGARINISSSGTGDGATPTGNDYASDTVGLRVAGDLDLRSALYVGGWNQLRTSLLEVGGDLIMTNGASSYLYVFAGCRDDRWGDPEMFREGGANVLVRGLTHIGNGANVWPVGASLSGAPVVFRLNDLRLYGRFYASYGGYYVYISNGELVGYAPGTPRTRAEFIAAPYSGGSYGGLGGGTKTTATYGTDFAPYQPGCPGGNTEQARGGGTIRIDCAGTAELYGSLVSNGGDGTSSRGGRSGGGIWLTARTIVSSSSASIQAKGGNQADNANSLGGGGGRICLAQKLTQQQIAELYTAEELPRGYQKINLLTDSVPEWQGTINVSGGSLAARPANDGHPGTAVFLRAPIPPTIILLR